jgi:hypothetical protein
MLEPHGPSGIVQILAVESPDLAKFQISTISQQRVEIDIGNFLGKYEGLHTYKLQ